MPSPLGHALGGLAVGFLAPSSRSRWLLVTCALAAAVADTDLLLPMRHRGASHSLGAAAIAGLATWAILAVIGARREAPRIAALVAVAYSTHVVFDWLGADSSTPRGLMALWPVSSSFFISDLDVFDSVDRRYWLDGFVRKNTIAIARELAILLPAVAACFWYSRLRKGRG